MSPINKNHDSYYRSLTRNIVLIVVSVSVIPLILITLTIRHFSQTSFKDNILKYLKVLNKEQNQNINGFLYQRLADISLLMDSYTFDQLANHTFLEERLKSLQKISNYTFVDLGVVDSGGVQLSYAGPFGLKSADYGDAPWFKDAIRSDTYISDVFLGLRDIPHFIVAVKGDHNGSKWLLRGTVDFEKFNSVVQNIRIGETGVAFIFNKKGEIQTNSRLGILLDVEPYTSYLASTTPDAGSETTIRTLKDNGVNIIHVMSRLKNGDWVLAFRQTEQDAYKSLYAVRSLTILIFSIGIVGILMVSAVLARRIVSRIKRVDEEKEILNEKMIEAGKLASIGELAAGIAHEINNPVAVMVEEAGWMQDLIADADPGSIPMVEEFERSLNQIKAQGVRCKQITHKLLSFARKTDPVPKRVNINEVTREAITLCKQRLTSGNVKIQVEFTEGLPPTRISPSETQQILVNLINNAVDALEPKGGIIRISTKREDDYLVVDVSDNGPGIPKSIAPRIFDPFFTTKPVGKGTGLGLSICYGIVKELGGEITVDTEEGVGTSFHVKFPVSKVIEKEAKS